MMQCYWCKTEKPVATDVVLTFENKVWRQYQCQECKRVFFIEEAHKQGDGIC